MFSEKDKKVQRQNWKPHPALQILYRVWRVAYSGLKIVLGAVATVLLICVVCGFVFANYLGEYLQEDVMSKAEMNLDDFNLDRTSYIYYLDESGDIQILQQIYSTTDRRWASYEELPEDLIHACVAIEDKRFYEHQGVDWITTVKACLSMFFGGDQFGGSTITQQLIKNLKEEDSVTVQRKVIEIFRAIAFEKKYEKETVLEWYMNTVFFGDGCYGVKSAADNYFGKELQDMTTAELAALIGITNNPSLYRPNRTTLDKGNKNGAQRNRERQEVILGQMLEQGWLNRAEYDAAMAQEMVFKEGIEPQDRWTYCEDILDDDGNVLSPGCGFDCAVRDLVASGEGENITYACPVCGNRVNITTDSSQSIYSWYVDQVLNDVAKALAERDGSEWNDKVRENYLELIKRAGYHIYTPYDPQVQAAVDNVYTDLSKMPEVKNGQQLQSGIVITDNRTGDIVALAGGVGEKDTFFAYNRADATLQVGSAIKPLTVYSQAFELGLVTPATVVADLPITTLNGRPYPSNVEKQYHYSRTILNGVIQSVNTLSVNTLDMIGTQYSFDFAKNQYGLSYLTDHHEVNGTVLTDVGYSALGMGGLTVGATVRQMTCAYGTFSNGGVYREGRVYTKVYDSVGKLVLDNQQEQRTVLSEKAVNYMNYCLDKTVESMPGVDMYAELGMDVAGKTGSTNDYKDRYFCGFTGYYTAGVWCGFDTPEEILMVNTYDSPATNLWKQVMLQLHEGKETVPLYDTEDMVQVSVCLDSGKLATEACMNDIRKKDTSRVQSGIWVYEEDAPTEFCDKHIQVDYCTEGNACANTWCKKFAGVGAIRLEQTSLVKMTRDKIEEILELKGEGEEGENGLVWYYLRNDYVYLVDHMGNPLPYHGMEGKLDPDSNLPYLACQVHTEKAWEEYKKNNPWVENETQEPDNSGSTAPTKPSSPKPTRDDGNQ